MQETRATADSGPPDVRRFSSRLFVLWIGGMGFGGQLALVTTSEGAIVAFFVAAMLMALGITFFSALASVRLFNEALTYRGENAPGVEVPEVEIPDIV